MQASAKLVQVYLEIGKKKTFAGAIDWPGWCRVASDEQAALQALKDYGSRYADVLRLAGIELPFPLAGADFEVVERLDGDSGTDFGAPSAIPTTDSKPVDTAELRRLQRLLDACWKTLDKAAGAAAGKELRKGPRGGGRDVEGILQHVLEAEKGYLSRIGGQAGTADVEAFRTRVLEALATSSRGEVAPQGPRGGTRWPPRYFARRAAWHILDHAWEIEDRVV